MNHEIFLLVSEFHGVPEAGCVNRICWSNKCKPALRHSVQSAVSQKLNILNHLTGVWWVGSRGKLAITK